MTDSRTSHGLVGYLWKIPAVALVYFVGTLVSGALVTMTGLQFPEFPGQGDAGSLLGTTLIQSLLLAACLVPLARGLGGSFMARWLVLALFTYVCFGLGNQIEAAAFATLGGFWTMVVFFLLPCALVAAAAAWWIESPEERLSIRHSVRSRLFGQPVSDWWWRLLLAWLAFPAIYYVFGILVSPFVIEAYQQQEFGLVLPEQAVIIRTVLLRSLLFLAVTVPILAAWVKSRHGLILALGTAYFFMMGLIGLIWTDFLPRQMRIAHGVEILADSMVYALVMVALLVPRKRQPREELSPTAAH